METAKVEADAEQLEVAAILCDLGRLMRAQDRRKRRRERARAAAFPSWGRRRPRSTAEENPSPAPSPAAAPAPAPAASPDTPLAYPESGGDEAPPPTKDKGQVAAAARPRDQWAEEQRGEAAASLSQSPPEENARPLKVARREQDDPAAVPAPAPLVALDLNEPARAAASAAADGDEQRLRLLLQARAAAAAEWYRQAQIRDALQKAAVSAGARRRRLEILRAKAACPLPSASRMRRAR